MNSFMAEWLFGVGSQVTRGLVAVFFTLRSSPRYIFFQYVVDLGILVFSIGTYCLPTYLRFMVVDS